MSHTKEISDIHDVSFEMAECLNNNETAISNLETALFEIAEMMNKEWLNMAKLYVKYIKAGKKTIDDVPSHWREQVEEMLKADPDYTN